MFFSLYCTNKKNTNKIESQLDPIEVLKNGNIRFTSGVPINPDETLIRIRELKKGQDPSVIVVSCSDSRVPPEIIFDQGLGDIFTIRAAGNVIGDYELGSIEYAIEKLHCNSILVLGHENCGAIAAFLQTNHFNMNNHIENIIKYIANEKEEKLLNLDSLKKKPDLAIRANIKHGINLLKTSLPILKPRFDKGTLKIVGAYYQLETGKVLFDNF
ncbi:MAG: carbonic anhydrase [Alphaproteobacteria bacterium]|nr:carbonic anhydrase [Alphaproteobacteria bacterium]